MIILHLTFILSNLTNIVPIIHFITIFDILKQKIDLMITVRIFFVPEVVAENRKKNWLKSVVSGGKN